MAKKKTPKMNATSDYQQIQENIRKAKGNPNKNVHHKKNNSNYHGYQTEAEKARAQEFQAPKSRTPLWVKIALGVCFAALLLMIVLINTSLKGNAVASYATALLTGVSCLLVYYSRRFSDKPETTFFKVLGWILVIMGIVYGFMGLYGLFTVFTA